MGKVGTAVLIGTTAICLIMTTALATYVLTRPDQAPVVAQAAPQVVAPQYVPPPQVVAPQLPPAQPATLPMNSQLTDKAQQIVGIVSRLEGATSEAGRTEANAGLAPIQIFFDPRCPYCHKLFSNIDGKVPIHWIPVSALSPAEGGVSAGAAIIQAEKDKPGSGVELIRAAFDKKLEPFSASEEHKNSLDQNLGSFVLMAKTLPPNVQPGVPLAIIPKRDGSFESHVGYSDGDEAAIISAYGK